MTDSTEMSEKDKKLEMLRKTFMNDGKAGKKGKASSVSFLNEIGLGENINSFSTGALSVNIATGVGGIPRGRVTEIYGPESSGKCLTKDTLVLTKDGLLSIEEIFGQTGQKASTTSRMTDVSDFGLQIINENGEYETIQATTHNNMKKVKKIVLSDGRELKATFNHPVRVLTENGNIIWKRAGQVKVGDTAVSVLGEAEKTGSETVSKETAALLGYLVAEGSVSRGNTIHFTNYYDEDVKSEYRHLLATFAEENDVRDMKLNEYASRDDNYNNVEFRASNETLRNNLLELGLAKEKSAGKVVPVSIRKATAELQAEFLSALFEGDGWVEKTGAIGYSSLSHQLVDEIQLLLRGLGIASSVNRRYNKKYDTESWTLLVSVGHGNLFMEKIGFRSERKEVLAGERIVEADVRASSVPHIQPDLMDLIKSIGGDREAGRIVDDLSRDGLCESGHISVSQSRMNKILAWSEDKEMGEYSKLLLAKLRFIVEQNYTYETVVEVEDMGKLPTFDIMVGDTHSFIANGVINHNTTLTLHAIADCQRKGGVAAFIDAEHALDPEYAMNIGVNTDELLFSQPESGDAALQTVEMLVNSKAVDLIIIDSVAALVPEAELKGEIGDSHVGLQARLMSQALRKITGGVSHSNSAVVFINQLREKVGVFFGSPETTSGGKALKFYASMRIDVRRIGSKKDNEGNVVSNETKVKIVKNKVAPPFKEARSDIIFGQGFSREMDVLNIAIDYKIVKKSGSWISYEGQQVGQGLINSADYLEKNPDVLQEIEGKIMDIVNKDKEEKKQKMRNKRSSESTQESGEQEPAKIEEVQEEESTDEF